MRVRQTPQYKHELSWSQRTVWYLIAPIASYLLILVLRLFVKLTDEKTALSSIRSDEHYHGLGLCVYLISRPH